MNTRIKGIDVARALAVIGMIIVNFKIVFGQKGNELLKSFTVLFEGKAAAIFVVLAGVGIAIMSNDAIKKGNLKQISKIQIRLIKKSVFLFIVGLLFIPIWIADILHFYGVYMIITLFFLKSSKRLIFTTSLLTIMVFPLFMSMWNFDTNWNFTTYEYTNFWTVDGFIRNLFYNGFHPVIPWVSFMFIGLWFGKHDLNNKNFIKKSILISSVIFISTLLLSKSFIYFLSDENQITLTELNLLFGTSPMPPLPIYMISASSLAILIISFCIFISRKHKKNKLIIALKNMGKLALTFYVAHIIIGIGIFQIVYPEKMDAYSIEFSVLYAIIFSITSILFAIKWLKHFKIGPLEWLMRKMTN